jgi:hypothetical protein
MLWITAKEAWPCTWYLITRKACIFAHSNFTTVIRSLHARTSPRETTAIVAGHVVVPMQSHIRAASKVQHHVRACQGAAGLLLEPESMGCPGWRHSPPAGRARRLHAQRSTTLKALSTRIVKMVPESTIMPPEPSSRRSKVPVRIGRPLQMCRFICLWHDNRSKSH